MQPQDLFKVHLENTRSLDAAFDLTARQCREAIARRDAVAIGALTKTCAFLLGARMENRLFRLLYEPSGLDDNQRVRILAGASIEESWIRLISEAFAARRGLRPSQVPQRLSFTDAARHNELVRLIRDHLAPLITLRNVLGHGQWHRALTSQRSGIDPDRMRLLNTTHLWHLKIKANLLEHFVWLLHDLLLTRIAFERDFDKRWSDLQSANRRLELNHYKEWEAMLQSKYDKRPRR